MGYQRSNNRYGGDDERWQRSGGQPQGMGDRDRYNRDYRGRSDRDDDRGFFERAGEEVRSWFSDDDDHERYGRVRHDRDRAQSRRDNRWDGDDDRDRMSRQDNRGYYGSDFNRSDDQYAHGDTDHGGSYGRAPSEPAQTWGGSGYGGRDFGGRRFDRVDSGSTGTHGAHPMAAPYGAGGGMYGADSSGFRSSARTAAVMGATGSRRGQQAQDHHDRHYSEWRNQQIDSLDRDYDEYRREHQSRFEQEFGNWRTKRQGQRSSMSKVTEHMEVVGSDGEKVGTVDYVRGDRIVLAKNDENAGGAHHSIPCSWIESVDERVTINKTQSEAMNEWKNEEHSRALFEREDQGQGGPHALNRSFSGTY